MMEHNTKLGVPIPERFNIRETSDGLEISWRWFSWVYLFTLFFCIFWFGFLAAWYAMALGTSSASADDAMNWTLLLFPLIHVMAGLFLLYSTVCGFVNYTTIMLSSSNLCVRHHPLPWWGSVLLATNQIKQLYVKQKVTRTKNGTRISYTLYGVDIEGKSRKIISNTAEEEVQYLEYILEKRMGIKNNAVEGEFKINSPAS